VLTARQDRIPRTPNEADQALSQHRGRSGHSFDECRLACFSATAANSSEPFFQPRIIKPAESVRQNTYRVSRAVQRRLPHPIRQFPSPGVGCYKSDSVGIVTARLVRE
jgi:hypothetical protein